MSKRSKKPTAEQIRRWMDRDREERMQRELRLLRERIIEAARVYGEDAQHDSPASDAVRRRNRDRLLAYAVEYGSASLDLTRFQLAQMEGDARAVAGKEKK